MLIKHEGLEVSNQDALADYYNFSRDDNWLEMATISNYSRDPHNNILPGSTPYNLQDYIDGNHDVFINTIESEMGWKFDKDKSDYFFSQVLNANKDTFELFDHLKEIVDLTVKGVVSDVFHLLPYHKSIIIAKACEQKNVNPIFLHWDDIKNILDEDTNILIEELERLGEEHEH
jgi:hypothetical protein